MADRTLAKQPTPRIMAGTTVLIADDQAIVRAGIEALLRDAPGMHVVASVDNGLAAVDETLRLRPDIVLMDVSMPSMNGLEAAARLAQAGSTARVIILSQHDDEATARRAVRAGVRGYLLKSSAVEELLTAIHSVRRGHSYFAAPVCDYVASWANGDGQAGADPLAVLSGRQRQVLQLIAEGLSTKGIAFALSLSVSTVESHRAELMRRLNRYEVASLVRFAMREGLVTQVDAPGAVSR